MAVVGASVEMAVWAVLVGLLAKPLVASDVEEGLSVWPYSCVFVSGRL